jgi:hypothetical protein
METLATFIVFFGLVVFSVWEKHQPMQAIVGKWREQKPRKTPAGTTLIDVYRALKARKARSIDRRRCKVTATPASIEAAKALFNAPAANFDEYDLPTHRRKPELALKAFYRAVKAREACEAQGQKRRRPRKKVAQAA